MPKDLRALLYQAKTLDIQVPLLSAITQSNQLQIQRAIDFVMDSGSKRVGLLGLTFKAGVGFHIFMTGEEIFFSR